MPLSTEPTCPLRPYNVPVEMILIGAFLLAGLVAGYLWGRNERTPERARQVAESFESSVAQLTGTEEYVRISGILALEEIANHAPRHRPYVLRIFADYLRNHSKANGHGRVLLMGEDGEPPPIDFDIQTIVEALGRLTRMGSSSETVSLDLTHINLSGARLARVNLTGALMRDCLLSGADLSGANLRGADLSGCSLQYARLKGTNLSARLSGWVSLALFAPINGLWLTVLFLLGGGLAHGAIISTALGTILVTIFGTLAAGVLAALIPILLLVLIVARVLIGLYNSVVIGALTLSSHRRVRKMMESHILGRASLENADLRHADLSGAYLVGANLRGANFAYANMDMAVLNRAHLEGADLRWALNLHQRQLNTAFVNAATQVPEHLVLPAFSTDQQESTPEASPEKSLAPE